MRTVAWVLSVADPDKVVNLGAKATEARAKALSARGALARAGVVHFATHVLVAGETAMLAANHAELVTPPKTARKEDDGLLTASEVTALKLDADWVILLACNTAAGDLPGYFRPRSSLRSQGHRRSRRQDTAPCFQFYGRQAIELIMSRAGLCPVVDK